jgi:mannose/cellobiose epimerase-like protein (N-acyl-D-glucosamine 2-epimerase family)
MAPIDTGWFRRTLLEDLRRYHDSVVTPSGFFRPLLDRRWRPVEKQSATLVSQCRWLFVLATGCEMTGERRFCEAVQRGGDYLLRHFWDREHGGWYRQVSPGGYVLNAAKDSYGHAFAVYGLAHAWRVSGQQRFRDAAFETQKVMRARFAESGGFLKPAMSRDFGEVAGVRSQNPIMHWFEALLALHEAAGSPEAHGDAEGLAGLVFAKLYRRDAGYLPELFDAEWKPLAEPAGGRIELGHQFEWAYLLSEAVRLGFAERYLETGRRLLDYGLKYGYDAEHGGFFSRADYGGRVAEKAKGWWEQCEAQRAILRYAVRHGRGDLWPVFHKSLAFVKEHFLDAEFGGWYRDYNGRPREGRRLDKGSHWMAGYHVTNFYLEALRVSRG